MDSIRRYNTILIIAFNILDCAILIFGQSDPYSLYFTKYQEYGSLKATVITRPTGINLQLSCASEKLLDYSIQDHYITWDFKPCAGRSNVLCHTAEKNPAVPICGTKMQPCRKKLTIHKPNIHDSGIYSCTIHKRDTPEYNFIVSKYQVEFIGKIRNSPTLLGDEPKNKSVAVAQQVGLECKASSTISPTNIKWLRRVDKKNLFFNNHTANIITYNNYSYHVIQGNRLTDPYYVKEAGPFSDGVYLSKLVIKKVEVYHAGYYACVIINTVGINYREMYLTVLPFAAVKGEHRRPPQLLGDQLRNVSAVVPQTAMLECRVRSFLPPVVRWVRRIDQISFRTPNLSSPVSIEYINNSYQMLTWNYSEGSNSRYYIDEIGLQYNDVYVSKLIFPVTTIFDTGFYACVVMNDMGIVHREIFLNVIPMFLSKDDKLARTSLTILISVPALLTIVTTIVCYQKWKQNIITHHENQHYERSQVCLEHCTGNTVFHPVIIFKGPSVVY